MSDPAPRQLPARLPELLAPAGSPEAFRSAIAAGADAVYLGGKRFGARKSSVNFTDTQIEEAVRTAHRHGVRVYVTVNTLIHDRELKSASEYLVWLWSIGVDAVLVQDTGLAAVAREIVPDLVLHASTQLTIHNAAGVRWAAAHGFRRVVLARELSLEEVGAIAEATDDTGTGLEVFVHGALCYSYSGQCLLSSVIGGRSGNRGMCAQPCRKAWDLVTGPADEYGRPLTLRPVPLDGRYLLSPKDLCMYRSLPRLVQSPAVSLKIEGRMKSPEYVATVVSIYRRALDTIAAGRWEPADDDECDLLLAFNRGFTGGYLSRERHRRLMGRDAPDNRGLLIGTVAGYNRETFHALVRPSCSSVPRPGDGLLITGPQPGAETGFALNHEPRKQRDGYLIRVPRPVRAGAAVFITASRSLDARARQIVSKPPPELLRPVPLDLVAEIMPGGRLVLSGSIVRPDGKVLPITCRPEIVLEPAGSRPLRRETFEAQLSKSGGTPFVVRSLALTGLGGQFAPLAQINQLRREFLAAAEEQLVASYRPPVAEVRHAQHRWQERMGSESPDRSGSGDAGGRLHFAVVTDTPDGVKEACRGGADTILFEPDLSRRPAGCGKPAAPDIPHDQVRDAAIHGRESGTPVYWKLPRIISDACLDDVARELPALTAAGLAGVAVDQYGAAELLKKGCPDLVVYGFTGLNIFNNRSARALGPLAGCVTLSPELSRDEIAVLCRLSGPDGPKAALVVQGTGETMITEDCLKTMVSPCNAGRGDDPTAGEFTGIRDEYGKVYPVRAGTDCRTRIGTAQELCLVDHLPSLRDAGISEVIVDARSRPARYTGRVVSLYRQALEYVNARPGTRSGDPFLTARKEEIRAVSLGGITPGHFLSGLRE